MFIAEEHRCALPVCSSEEANHMLLGKRCLGKRIALNDRYVNACVLNVFTPPSKECYKEI